MRYKLSFHEKALKEWQSLDDSIKRQFKKKLAERLENPLVQSAKLSGKEFKSCYKIKLQALGYRLVYRVDNRQIKVFVITVGKRDKKKVYATAIERLTKR